MNKLEQNLGYEFKNKELLALAMSHSSYVNEARRGQHESNERLEFLGDSVLSVIVSEYLYKTFSTIPEGKLTKIRAAVVCEKTLAVLARKIEIGNHIRLGKGEKMQNGQDRDSILADAFEALLAAVYLDSDLETVRGIYLPMFVGSIAVASQGSLNKDYKTTLQEIVQKNREDVLEYFLIAEEGPDNNKTFVYEVRLDNNVIGTGKGRSKKDAQQAAAREALVLMGEEDE